MMHFFQPRFYSGQHHIEGYLCRHNYGFRILLLPWQTLKCRLAQMKPPLLRSLETTSFPLHGPGGSQNPVCWLPKSQADLSHSRCVPVVAFFITLRWKLRPSLLPSPLSNEVPSLYKSPPTQCGLAYFLIDKRPERGSWYFPLKIMMPPLESYFYHFLTSWTGLKVYYCVHIFLPYLYFTFLTGKIWFLRCL